MTFSIASNFTTTRAGSWRVMGLGTFGAKVNSASITGSFVESAVGFSIVLFVSLLAKALYENSVVMLNKSASVVFFILFILQIQIRLIAFCLQPIFTIFCAFFVQ